MARNNNVGLMMKVGETTVETWTYDRGAKPGHGRHHRRWPHQEHRPPEVVCIMTLKVLGRASSINVRKVLWTCAELDLHFEHVESDPALLARNPNRQVPVIQDGEFVLVGVERHLPLPRGQAAAQHAVAGRPRGACAGGTVDGLAGHGAQHLLALRFHGAGAQESATHADPAAIAASVDALEQAHAHPRRAFRAGGQFITGEFFTLADVVLGLSTHRWLHSPIERPPLDAVHGYYQRLSVRPAFRAHVDPHVP